MSTIDLQLPTSAFTGAHIQNTVSEPDVSTPIVIVVNPQPAGNPSGQGIFDALKDAARNMIFRLENKNAAGTAFLAQPELRSYAGTYADFTHDGFEIRESNGIWGIYHRKSDGKDASGNAPTGYVYKNVVYGFDLEHKFAGFQSMVQASRQAKLTAANFIDAADLNHTTGQQHMKVSPMTEADAFASLEVYECTNDGGATVESNTLRIKPGAESADKTLTYDSGNGPTDLTGAITAAALGPFSDAVKTKLDDNKSTIQFNSLVQRTKDIQSIVANTTSSATQEIQIRNADKFPRSDQSITGAVFNATAATMPLTIGQQDTVPTNNGTAPSQALAFKASIGTAATAREETVTIEDKDYSIAAHRNTQLLTLNQARFAAQGNEIMPETTLAAAAVDATVKTVTVKVGGTTVVDAKTYNVKTNGSGSLTFQNHNSWGVAATPTIGSLEFKNEGNADWGGDMTKASASFTVNAPEEGAAHTITVGGTPVTVTPAVGSNMDANTFATELRNGAPTGYTAGGADAVVIFTKDDGQNFTVSANPKMVETSQISDGTEINTSGGTANGYTITAYQAGSTKTLYVTVDGNDPEAFTIGKLGQGHTNTTYTTKTALRNAVVTRFTNLSIAGLTAAANGDDKVDFTKADGTDLTIVHDQTGICVEGASQTITTGTEASNSTLTITVQGYDAKPFAIGQVAGGYSALSALADAVAAAFDAENGVSAVSDGTDTVTFSKTTGDFTIDTNSINNSVVTGTTQQQTSNYVAAGDYTTPAALASAIQSGVNAIADIHADLDPDGSGNNTIVNIRGTKVSGSGSLDTTQTIPIQITQTGGLADTTGRCDAFEISGAGAFPTGMTHTVFGSDSTGKAFDYSVRINGENSGGTVSIAAGKADVDAALDDIHTAFNAYKGNNATKWTRAEKVLLEGTFDGPADLTKKIALADSSGDISGGSAGEKLCLFDFQPVIGNKATASGDFTTAADSVSAAFKAKVKLGGFVALCAADNTVLSYLEVIPGYVVEGSGSNAAKLESYDTSTNPFLTKNNGASAEVTVAGVANGPVIFNTNKTVGFHANDDTTIGASRIGSALVKASVIAAFEKGSVNASNNFTQAYNGTTIRVYYADTTATASLTHNDGNNDVIQQSSAISALQFAEPAPTTLTIQSSHDDGNGNSRVTVNVGATGNGNAIDAAAAAAQFVTLFTAAKKTAGKIASVTANGNVLTFTGFSEGANAVDFTLQDGSGNALNANPLVAANTTPYANGTHETVTLTYGTGASAKAWGPKTIGKAPKDGVAGAADHFLTSQAAADDFYAWANTGGTGDLIANVDKITGVAQDGLTVTISGDKSSGTAANSFQFTKTGDANDNVTANDTELVTGTEATNDIIYTITAKDTATPAGNSTSATVQCGHSNGALNTAASIQTYILSASCDLGAMIGSKAANGANVTLSGRANGKPFAVTITATQGGNAVDITAGNHLSVGVRADGSNIGQITYTVASEHGIFTGDTVDLKGNTANAVNNETGLTATRVSATEFSVVLTGLLSTADFTNSKVDNKASRNVKLQFKKGNDFGTEQTIALSGTAQDVRNAIVTALDAVKDEGSKGYASAVAAKANSNDTLVITSTAPTSDTDDQTFIIKVTDDADADAIVQDGETSVPALGSNLFNTTVITLGAGHGILADDVVTLAGTTNTSNDMATKVVRAVAATTISLAETGVNQATNGGTVKVHNLLDMTMQGTLGLSLKNGGNLKLGPATVFDEAAHTAANFDVNATMKDVIQEFWTYSKNGHGLSTGDIVQQLSETGFEVEIARGVFTKTDDDSGAIRQVKGRFEKNNAFALKKSTGGGAFTSLSSSASTELTLTSTSISGATRAMFRLLKDGTEMDTQSKFEVGNYYVLNTGVQVLKAAITGTNAADFGLNNTALAAAGSAAQKKYDFKLEAGALSVLSGPASVADELKSGIITFTVSSGMSEGNFGTGASQVIQFVLKHDSATGSSNDANWGYYSDGTSPDNTQTKTLAGLTKLNTGSTVATDDYTIASQLGNKLDGSGSFSSASNASLVVTMKNSNNNEIEFGTATFVKGSNTGAIDMTLNLNKNTFLLDSDMEFEFTLKLVATNIPAGIPTEDATVYVLYKFTNFQKPYALHSNQDFATRATWRTLSNTANASIADFSMIGETFNEVNDNFYVASRTQAQLLDIDGLTWAYNDHTAGEEKYTASISLSDAKSTQISNYGRLGADIHADLKALKAGAGDSFTVPVQVDFLNKAVKGGFTKKNGDDQTFHYSDLSFTDEVRDPDSVKIHTLDVAYTAGTSVVLTIKCDDVNQKALNQISDNYPANMSTNRKKPFGASNIIAGKITQFVSMDGVAIAAGNLANAANLPMTSGNFQLQIDSEASSVALTSTTTQANIDGRRRLTVNGDISLNNALAIAAGTQIIFQSNTSKLTGALTCNGTATDPIVFKSTLDSIDDVGKVAAGRESNWKSVSLAAESNCTGCVFLGGGNGQAGTVITNGAVTMTNCAIFNSAAKSISVASGSPTLDFITVGNNATDAPDGTPTNLMTLTAGVMVKSNGSGSDTFAAANREWFATQNRVDMHLSYAVPNPYDLTTNADQGAGAFIFYRSSLAGGINVFRMNSSSKSSVARAVSLYNPALVTLDQAADLSFARRTAFTDQTIGTLKLDGAALNLKDGSIPAGIYVYLDKENTQGSLKRNLDTGLIQLSRSATDIPSQVTVKVSNSNRGIFDVDSKDDLAAIDLTYTEDPNLEVKHHEKVVNPFRKVIEAGDYTGAIDVAGMTQVIIDGPVVLKGAGASLAFDANTDVVMIERDRTVTTGVLSMRADELVASIDDNIGFAVGTYYADLTGGDGTGGKVKIVVGAGGAITSLDVTHQGSGFAAGNTLTVGTATRDEDDNNDLGKDLTITLTASDVADVYPYDMSGIIENGGEVSFGAGCVVRTNTDYQLSKANKAKVLGMVCGSTTNPTKRFYINRELVSLAVEAPTGNAANMFFVPCRMASCTAADAKNLTHANRLTDAIRLPATVDDYSCTDVALVDQALTINATKTLRVEPGARLVGHKNIAEKIAGSAMGAKTVTVTGTLQCLGFDSTNAAELHGLNVAGAGSIQLRHALVTLLGDSDKIDFNTADADSFIDRVEIKATASGSRAAGLTFGANLNTRASVLEARQIKMDGAPIQVETSNLLLQDCDVLNIDSSKYGVKVTTYGSTIRKIRVNGEKLVEGATGTLLNSVQNGTFMKDVEQGIVGASEGAFENDLVIHNVAAAAFNARARLYAEKEANDNSIALTKSLTAANGFVDARVDAALATYNNQRAGFNGAEIADRAAFRAAIAMDAAADYFMHVGQTYAKDVDQLAVKESTTKMAELFLGHMILNGELLSRVEVALSVESATADVFDDDSLTRTIVAATEKCTFKGTLATTAFTFTQKPILLVNGGLRDAQSTQSDPQATNAAATNTAVEIDAFNAYATLGNQTMNYASVAATGDLGTPAKKRVLVSQSDLLTVTINAALDGTSTYKYDPYIIQSEYGRLDKGAYNLARSAGDLAYVGIFGSRGVALTANDNHVAILHTLGHAASGTLKNTYVEDCTGHAIAGNGVLNTRVECVDYGDRLCSGDVTQGGAVLYAESEKAPRGSEASQFGGDVTNIQAPHVAFFTKSAGSSFAAISDASRLAHWWNPLKTFTSAYQFHDLTNTSSQTIVYGYLQADGTPAILNGGEAARLSATQIGATKFYELKKAAATPGAPKVHYKTAGSNAVEVSMSAEVTMAAEAAGTPTHQNSSDGNDSTKRTDRTANGDSIALQAAQLTLDNAALWGAKKQVVTATPPSGSYNELLLPANDAVEGSVQFASQKSIPTGTYTFKRIEYAVAKDLQYGAQGSMNPSPRGFTVSDTQTLTVTVEQQPKLQLFAKGAGAEAQLDADRTRILRATQLDAGAGGDIKAIVRVNIVNPDTIANISVIDPGNAKFTASDTKVVSVAGEHTAADATGQTLILKLNETAGAYSGANNGLTVQNVMEGEVANSEFGTQSVTIKSVTDINTVDIDGTYFDTNNNNTHLVCRNKWYDLPAQNVRSIAVNVNSAGTRPLAGDSRCTITATETLGNNDTLTDFIGDWVWTPDGESDDKTDTLTGTLSLPAQSETFGSGANTALNGNQNFNKPVVIIEGEVTVTGNVIVGANVDQILFKDNANLIITGNLTIDRDDLAKPVLVRHIDDHTLQFCQGEFKGIDVAGNATIKGLMIVGGKNQLKVQGGTLGGDTAAKGIRLINGCEKALQITGELSGHCQNVYIRGAKVGLEVSGTTAATELKDIRIDDCLNNALTVTSAVSIGDIFVNSPSEPRDANMSTLMGTGSVSLLSSTTQYMAADTRKQGSLTGISSWSAGDNGVTIQTDVVLKLNSNGTDYLFVHGGDNSGYPSIGSQVIVEHANLTGGSMTLTLVSASGSNYVVDLDGSGLHEGNNSGAVVKSLGTAVAKTLADASSTPLVNYDQAANADRMATLTTMGYVPAKDISTSAQVQYKEEYSHYYSDANMTASARTSTDATNSYKIQTKEYMQELRFSANQYTATKSAGNTADISGNDNKVHKDATLAWANNALTALQLFTGTSTRATGAITSIAKGSSSITMPTMANNDEYDLETLVVAAKYDFARLKINATPASTSATETKSASYSMFSTLAVYGDAPQFRILSKDSGADTNYIGTNAHNWLFAGSAVTGVGSCSPMVVLTFGTMPTVEYDIPVSQSGGASGRVYGIDTTNKKLLVGEVTGTFVTTENLLVNDADSSQAPTAVDKDNRLMKTADVTMGFVLNEAGDNYVDIDFNEHKNAGITAPQVLSYTMQNEAYLSVLDAHPFGIGDKRHANYTYGTTDADVMESNGSNYLSRSGPTFANDGEIVITQKDTIDLPDNDNTNDLIKVGNFSMPNAMTLSGTDTALSLQNLTSALTEVRGCIRPHLHSTFTAVQGETEKTGYSSTFTTGFNRLVAQEDSSIATMKISPALTDGNGGTNGFAVTQGADETTFIDFIQAYGTAPAAYTAESKTQLKDGYILEFDRGLQTNLVGNAQTDVTITFAKANNDVVISGLMSHGLLVDAFVEIKGAAINVGNKGIFKITAVTAHTFTIVNAAGVNETNKSGRVEEIRDLGLKFSDQTTLSTRALTTTLACRPGLKYKSSFGDSGANGTFTYSTQYFPKIQLDPTTSVIAGVPKMIDGVGTQCDDNAVACKSLNQIISKHASYIGPMGGMCLVEQLSVQDFSTTMEKTPKLFKLPEQQLDNTHPQGRTGTLEIVNDAYARVNGFKAKFVTDCCIYVRDESSQYALKTANTAHADSQSIGVLQKVSDSTAVLKVGDTITDGDGNGSGVVQKIVITKLSSTDQTIQIQMDTTTNIKTQSVANDTLKVGGNTVFTHGNTGGAISWTIGSSYYTGSSRPIADGHMVLFADKDNAGGKYGVLKAAAWDASNKTMIFTRTNDATTQAERDNERIPSVDNLADGNRVLFFNTQSSDMNLNGLGDATFVSGHQKDGENNKFKVVEQTSGEHPDKLLIMGLSTHGIRTNSNGVYENASSTYFLHMRFDNKEVDGSLFLNKVVCIKTDLANPYSMLRTTTVGNNSSADLQMSNIIRGTQKTPVTGFTSYPYEVNYFGVVNIDMSSNADTSNNPSHWGGARPTTRTQDLSGILIVNPDELTEHGSPYVQNDDGIHGALQALKRPSMGGPLDSQVQVTGASNNKKVTFGFTNHVALPANGKIVLTIPSSFTFAAAPAVEASNIDGSFAAATVASDEVGNIITITRNGAGTATAIDTAASITVTATALGATGTDGFEIYTTDSSGTILESDFKSRAITIA